MNASLRRSRWSENATHGPRPRTPPAAKQRVSLLAEQPTRLAAAKWIPQLVRTPRSLCGSRICATSDHSEQPRSAFSERRNLHDRQPLGQRSWVRADPQSRRTPIIIFSTKTCHDVDRIGRTQIELVLGRRQQMSIVSVDDLVRARYVAPLHPRRWFGQPQRQHGGLCAEHGRVDARILHALLQPQLSECRPARRRRIGHVVPEQPQPALAFLHTPPAPTYANASRGRRRAGHSYRRRRSDRRPD